MVRYLQDQFVLRTAGGRRLAAVNLIFLAIYAGLRTQWPMSSHDWIGWLAALCFALIVVFALNIRRMLIVALPQIQHGMVTRDHKGQRMVVKKDVQGTSRSFPVIVVSYIATLAFGFLFLIELMQLSARLGWVSCAPIACDADRMALATRVVSGALNGDLHITAETIFGLIVLLVHSIMNIVLLTLLIPALLAFRD